MSYSVIAPLYDRINGEQYRPYADFLQAAFRRYATVPVREVLDLGCGTGRIAALLADAGYDLVALDASPEMLTLARENNVGRNTLLICQDMRSFELYGTVQAVYSSFDCLNYLRTAEELERTFSLVHLYLEPGGAFVFDVNTAYRFGTVFGENTFTYEFSDGLLVWRCEAGKRSCRFLLDWFARRSDGTYTRSSEVQTEYLHTPRTLREVAKRTGFSVEAVLTAPDLAMREPSDVSEKEYYILRRLP